MEFTNVTDAERQVVQLRSIIYDCVSYLPGASDKECALAGIAHGGRAKEAGEAILKIIAQNPELK